MPKIISVAVKYVDFRYSQAGLVNRKKEINKKMWKKNPFCSQNADAMYSINEIINFNMCFMYYH